jgi:molybdenum cofactor cytidylyltransferase
MDKTRVCGIVLSAGLSGRMGKFKPLIPYQGKSFIQNIVLKLSSVCDKIFIVTGFKVNEVEENVNKFKLGSKIEFVFNPEYNKGMFTSLQKGILEAKNCEWILYHFVDQPGLPNNFYTEFTSQVDGEHNWIQPSFRRQRGHPILFHKNLFDLIINASANSSLREVSNIPVVKKKYWECLCKEILQDIDTEEDLSSLK